jgi:hypothetical protein
MQSEEYCVSQNSSESGICSLWTHSVRHRVTMNRPTAVNVHL